MPETLRPGQFLDGRYLLIDRIGRGGMSTVWRARDERLGRIAAVKVLAAELLADEDSRDRLRVEAQALARLHHPHIADIYDYGTDDVPFLVMELVDGVPLSQALADERKLPWTEAASVCAQVAAALDSAHQRGVVHRDVTTRNILLTADGVKVIDFGICESEGSPESQMLVGTPAYLAPERIVGRPVQPESDVYALGVLLYRMLAGAYPLMAETARQLMLAHRDQPPPRLPAVEGMPSAVAELCMSCLAKDPDERPDASEISRTLFDLLGGAITMPAAAVLVADDALPTRLLPWPESTPQTAPAAASSRLSRRAKTVLIASALLLAGGAVAASNGWDGSSGPRAVAGPGAHQAATCAVTYQAIRDSGRSFEAAVTVANLGASDIADGRLTFDLPGTQKLSASTAWQQNGQAVVNRSGVLKLPAGRGVRLPLSGTYSGSNAYPLSFQLDGRPCEVSVLGPSGTPVVVAGSPGPSGHPGIVDTSAGSAANGSAAPAQPPPSPAPPSPSSGPASPAPGGDPSPTPDAKIEATTRPQAGGEPASLSTSDSSGRRSSPAPVPSRSPAPTQSPSTALPLADSVPTARKRGTGGL